jgi:hypothetical protein
MARFSQPVVAALALVFAVSASPARATCPYTQAQLQGVINSTLTPGIPGGITANSDNALQTDLLECEITVGSMGSGVATALGLPIYATTPAPNALLTGSMIGTSGGVLGLLNGANSWSALQTLNSMTMTAEPSISYTFGGYPTLNSVLINVPGTNASEAESAVTLFMTSSAGNANALSYYKAGLSIGVEATGNSGSIWGQVISSTILPGFSGANPIGNITLELDSGNYAIAASGFSTPNTFNLFLSGVVDSAAHYNQGMICMCYAGANPLANYGLAAWDNAAQEFKIATIYDVSHSPTAYLDNGTHAAGINLAGSYSGNAFASPGFSVAGTGATNATGFNATTAANGFYVASNAALYDDGTYLTIKNHGALNSAVQLAQANAYLSANSITLRNAAGSANFAVFSSSVMQMYSPIALESFTIAGLPSCNSGLKGYAAFVSDTVANAAATFHGTVTGGGATSVNAPVTCNGSNWQYD